MFGKYLTKYPFQDSTFDGFWYKLGKSFIAEHFPCAADGICSQSNDRTLLIHAIVDFADSLQRFHTIKARHHMIQKNNIIGIAGTPFDCFLSAQAGIYLYAVAAKDTLCDYKIHLFIVNGKDPNAFAEKWLASGSLCFTESVFNGISIEQVYNRKCKKWLADHQKPAVVGHYIISFCNDNHPKCSGELFIIRTIFFIFCLRDENVSQHMVFQQFEQPFKIMSLITFYTKSFDHMQDHIVIISPDFVTHVLFCSKIACNAELFRMCKNHGRSVILHFLGDGDMSMQSLMAFAVKVDKSPHGMKQSPGNRKPESKPAGKSAASGVGLIKIITHLHELRIRHTDSGVMDINNQIDSITFLSVSNADVNASFFCKLDRIFQKDLKNMGDFFCISNQDRRSFRLKIKHHFKPMLAVLHGSHGDDIIEYRSNHVGFFRWSQCTFHNLCIVQHVIDLVGQTFASQLYGLHVGTNLRRNILFQYNFAESKNHINRSPKLMRYIGQKFCILPACGFQL